MNFSVLLHFECFFLCVIRPEEKLGIWVAIFFLGNSCMQYKFGISVSWEGNRRSGVALTMRCTTYGLTALEREMSTLPTLQ